MHKRLIRALSLGLLVLGSLAAFSCAQPVVQPPSAAQALEGYWKSSYGDGFEVRGNAYKQYDDATKKVSFGGEIVNSSGDAAGFLTVKITDAGSWGKTVGKFLVIRWKNKSATGISQAAPYKDGSAYNNGADTQALAESEFTAEKGYFGFYGDYLKQQ